MRLPQFQVGVWGPTVWVALEPQRRRSSTWLADVTPRLANYRTDEMRFAGGRRWEIGCNWKLYVDNYMEGYHIPFIHPGLAQSLSPTVYTYRLGEYSNEQYGAEPHPRGPGSRVAGILGGTQELRALKPPIAGLDEAERTGYYFHWVFPLTTINFTPDGILIFTVRPLGPERTESTFMWWFPEARSFQDRLLQAALVNFGHLVNTEDYEICEQAQRGMRSQVYRQGRYAARAGDVPAPLPPAARRRDAAAPRELGRASAAALPQEAATMSAWPATADELRDDLTRLPGAVRRVAGGRGGGGRRPRPRRRAAGRARSSTTPTSCCSSTWRPAPSRRAPATTPSCGSSLPAADMHDLLLERLGPVEISRLVEEGRLHLTGSPPALCAAVLLCAQLQPHYEASLRERGREHLLETPAPETGVVWESAAKPPPVFGVRRPWQPRRASRGA